MKSSKLLFRRLSAAAFTIAGVFFVLYPAIRPFSDEVSLEGAAAFASNNWIVAHMLAMVAFTLLLFGMVALVDSLEGTKGAQMGSWALLISVIGVGLTLPFYGGEAYGLHAVGIEAMKEQNAALLSLATTIRSGAGLVMFLFALLALAFGTIMLAIAIWRSGSYPRWSGSVLAAGVALYMPQFFGNQPLRIAHGVIMLIGCVWLAILLWPED
ncbi:MAG: hypothetical protein PVF85_05490 [Anaerolineales bacterium]|jgi:hypothetical protein